MAQARWRKVRRAQRNVALKLLPATESGSSLRERLLREAKAMAMVNHPKPLS